MLGAIYVAGALFSSMAPIPALLILARILLGFAVGGSSKTVPVYVAEVAPAVGRESFITTFNIAIGLEIMTAGTVGAVLHSSTGDGWSVPHPFRRHIHSGAHVLPALTFPESPRWLVQRDRTTIPTVVPKRSSCPPLAKP